jgi:membrane fusion protein (multidrug efflux system)
MKNLKTIIVVLVVLALLIFGKLWLFPGKSAKPDNKQKEKGQATKVVVTIVRTGKFDNEIYVSGTILANEEAVLRPEVAGRITQLLFKEGSSVSKGELLLKINDSDLQAQLKKLRAEVKLAEEKEDRQKKLIEIKGISQEEYEASLNQLNNLLADLEFTQAQVAKTEIRAPFNGTIGLKYVSEGGYVSAGMDIASVQQTNPVKIDFSVPEKYAGMIHKGDKIQFSIQGQPGKFDADIYAIEPRIDMATRTMQIRAICPNKGGNIIPGAFAKIDLLLQRSENTILIPTEAIVPEIKGQKVFLYKGGKSESQKVETGVRTDTKIEITGGLTEGDTLIISGIMQLKPGTAVKIQEIKNIP